LTWGGEKDPLQGRMDEKKKKTTQGRKTKSGKV